MSEFSDDEVRVITIAVFEYREALLRFAARFSLDPQIAPATWRDATACTDVLKRLSVKEPPP